jgi:hypothetical protein
VSSTLKSRSAVAHDHPLCTLATPHRLRRGVSLNDANLLCQHKSGLQPADKDIDAPITPPVGTIHFQEYWQKPTVYNCSVTNLEMSRLDRAKFSGQQFLVSFVLSY